ncbi:MAG: oligosaccharide flippase family protein [Candidatus Omnitrophica bacterium]|nr:oligosaccharide flippase family protein [Candidatus Omnitrophota bacterium]
MKLKSYLQKCILTGLGRSFGSSLISLIFIPLIIHNVGMEKYGIWMILSIFANSLSITDLGLSKAMVYFIPKQKSNQEINQIYSAGLIINSAIVLVIIMMGLTIYWLRIDVWGGTDAFPVEFGRRLLLYGLFTACISLATSFFRSVLEGFYKLYLVNLGFLLQTTTINILVYILSFFTGDVEHFIFGTMFIYVAMYVFHLSLIRLKTSAVFCRPGVSFLKSVIKYSLGVFSIGSLASVLQPMNGYLLVLFSGDMRIYGIFDVASKIAVAASGVLQSFVMPFFSVFSGYGKERINEIKNILHKCLMGLGGAYVVGWTLFFLIGRSILGAVIRNESVELYNATLIQITGVVLITVADPFFRAFLALGNLRLAFKIKIFQPIIDIICILLLGGLAPLYRFSAAYSIACGCTAIVYVVMFRMKYKDGTGQ